MFAEHHLDKKQSELVRGKLAAMGRFAFISPASRKGTHVLSTSGGQMILPKSHLDTAPLDPMLLQRSLPREQLHAPRWSAMVLRTKGVSILLVAAYLFTSEGLSERNMAILNQIAFVMLLLLVWLSSVEIGKLVQNK